MGRERYFGDLCVGSLVLILHLLAVRISPQAPSIQGWLSEAPYTPLRVFSGKSADSDPAQLKGRRCLGGAPCLGGAHVWEEPVPGRSRL